NDNPQGVLLYRDEIAGFLNSFERAGYESARAFFLECWNGLGSYAWDRIGWGALFVASTVLSIFGTIQPQVLSAYLDEALQGKRNDGLLQRFQLMVFPQDKLSLGCVDRPPDQEAKKRYEALFEQLQNFDFKAAGGFQIENEERIGFRFSQEAQE